MNTSTNTRSSSQNGFSSGSMTPLERVATTLKHQQPDRVPVYPLLNGAGRRLVGADYPTWSTNMDVCAEAYEAVTDRFGLDVICTLIDLSVEAADFGQPLIYPKSEAAHPDFTNHMIKSLDDYRRIEPINPRVTPRMSGHIQLCDRLVKSRGETVPVVAFAFAPLGILSMLRGQAMMFMDILDDPNALHRALAAINETMKEYCAALIETGVHAIMLDTLFASQAIMSKDMWRAMEGVYVQELADFIHSQGCMVMVHNCGTGIYFDAQIETMQPEAISFLHVADDCDSFEEMQQKYGSQTTFIGHVPPTWLLGATEAEVEAEVRKELDLHMAGGGYIMATGCEYPANLGFENAEAMIRATHTHGAYRVLASAY